MKIKGFSSGYSLIELLVSIMIISLLLFFSFVQLRSFFSRMEFESGVRIVTSLLSNARYRSIRTNRNFRFKIEDNSVNIYEKSGKHWKLYSSDRLKNVNAKIKGSPVFHPTGKVSPLCSIVIENPDYRSRITISIAGRVKIKRIL